MALIKLNNQSISAITSAGLPSGTLVGYAYSNNVSTTYINSTSFTSTGLTVSYTPIDYANNKIYVSVSGHVTTDDNDTQRIRFKVGVTGDHTADLISSQELGIDRSGGWSIKNVACVKEDTGFTANASATYTLYGNSTNSTLDFRPQNTLTFTVMEIAG